MEKIIRLNKQYNNFARQIRASRDVTLIAELPYDFLLALKCEVFPQSFINIITKFMLKNYVARAEINIGIINGMIY